MHTYHLQDDFIDLGAEQSLLASLAAAPARYWELLDILRADLFTTTQDTWQPLALALEAAQSPRVPADWSPAADPAACAQRLRDLHQRRLLAQAQERLAQALFDDTVPASAIATLLEEEVRRVQAALRDTPAGRLQ